MSLHFGKLLLPVKMIKLTGKVTLAKNEPLVGATVSVKGTTLGVATDMDGNYVLNVPETKGMVIVVSFVGMKTQEVGIIAEQRRCMTCIWKKMRYKWMMSS